MNLFPLPERMRVVEYAGEVIYYVDYSYLNEKEMIQLTQWHRDKVLEAGKVCYFIARYENAFATTEYMKAAFDFTKQTKPYIPKGAFLGITGVKVTLLKSVVFFLNANFKAFKTEEEALDFLLN